MSHGIAIPIIGELIPIVAIIMGIGMVMLSLYLDFRKKRELVQAYHAERMAAIEKGIEIPPLPAELLQVGIKREPHPARHRRNGLILLFLGIAISGALLSEGDRGALWGAIPAAIGLALLISATLETRERARGGRVDPGSGSAGAQPGSASSDHEVP
jgi:Domain of unknown function (DUF6249)